MGYWTPGTKQRNLLSDGILWFVRPQNQKEIDVLSKVNDAEIAHFDSLLQEEYYRLRSACEKARLLAWKKRLQWGDKQSHKWVKGSGKTEPTPMKLPDGHFTVDRNTQLDAILEQWEPIFKKYKDKPHPAAFLEHFGPTSAASLDNWRPSALSALAMWFPGLF